MLRTSIKTMTQKNTLNTSRRLVDTIEPKLEKTKKEKEKKNYY